MYGGLADPTYLIGVDGSGLRQVTPEEDRSSIAMESLRGYDDTDPVWLPDGRIVFTSTRYPSYAHYTSGDAADARSYECRTP